jgi:hypothetical protein
MGLAAVPLTLPAEEALDRDPRDAHSTVDPDHREWKVSALDRSANRRAVGPK